MKKHLDLAFTALLALTFMFVLTVAGAMMVKSVTNHYNTILKVEQ